MKDRWSQLSMSEKSDLMSLYIQNGISSLEEIKKHYNSYAEGGSIEDGRDNPPVKTYNFQLQPAISVADNIRVTLPPSPIEIAQARAAYEDEQRQKAMLEVQRRQPQLKADTKTKAEYNRRVNETAGNTMSIGRPNTESTQAAVMTAPYVAEAAKNYVQNFDPTAEIRNAMYFVPGVSNVMMAQDARTAFDNNQTGAGVVNAAFALAPMLGVTPNFNSPLRYTRHANRVGDWTILDYGRNTTTTPAQSSTTSMLSMPSSLRLSSVERPSLSAPTTTYRLTTPEMSTSKPKVKGNSNTTSTPKQINLPERFVDFVDKDGTVDVNRFKDFWSYVSNKYGTGSIDTDRIQHSLDVAKSAKELPLPKGVSRKDYVQAALLHDIGTAVEGHSKTHGPAGANIMKKIAGTQLSPAQYEAIEKHMDNTSYGKGRDLLKAVEFADAARGENLAQSLAFHPNLATYQFEPFNFTGASAAEDFISDMKARVNPVLKQTGLGTINTNQPIEEIAKQLNDKTRQWRTLIRGARDPKGTSMSSYEFRNIKNAEKLARQYYGDEAFNSNPEFYRTLISTNTVPLEDTGSGRAGFADARRALDLDKNIYDALYASNSALVGEGYKTGTGTDKGRLGLVRKVYLPFEEYGGESLPSEWMLGNFDWDLLDQNSRNFKSGKKTYGLTRFSQFDIPYRLQTGRSFMSDYGNTISQKIEKQKSMHTPVESPYYYKEQMDQIRTINSMLDKYGFNHISPFNEDGSIIYRGKENEELYNIMRLINTFPEQSFEELDKGNIYVRPEPTWGGTRALSGTEASDYKQRLLRFFYNNGMLSDAQYKKRKYIQIDKKYLIKKALDIYYTKNKKYKPTKEFLDQSKMMEFMLQQGVEPRVLNPNYLSTLAINTGGSPLPEGSPLFFNKNRGSNQLSIIAPKGTKVFEDLGDINLDALFNGIEVGRRHDFGHRTLGITTKFKEGGQMS